jgi:hypothetical protein
MFVPPFVALSRRKLRIVHRQHRPVAARCQFWELVEDGRITSIEYEDVWEANVVRIVSGDAPATIQFPNITTRVGLRSTQNWQYKMMYVLSPIV